ncbi:MAG: serine protease [Bacilli bacterium]|nr:serine protease [Bacilli bacterium]
MKNKNATFIMLSILVVVVAFVVVKEVIPIVNENDSKNRIFSEFDDKISELEKSIIGIIPKNESGEYTSYTSIGSGVIFEKEANKYYAITALHVVDYENSTFKAFTRNTTFSGEIIQPDNKINFMIPDEKYYSALLDLSVEYKSETTDLAIVSFTSDEELPVLEFETNNLNIGDKIICIGHPEGKRYVTTYGYITSNLKDSSYVTNISKIKIHDKVIEHNAYMNHGNSGGAAINENLKLVGINVGGSFSLLKHYKKGYMIPYDIVQKNINDWRNK